MHQKFILIIQFFLILFGNTNSFAETPTILVSVAPYKLFVERIAGDTAKVELLVPAGSSSHTYEPSPKQMINASKAEIWFQIGESFEPRASQALQNHRPGILLVDLRQGVDLIYDSNEYGDCCCCAHHCHKGSADPHFWLSARQAKIQIKTIGNTLIGCYPEHREIYQKRLADLLQELETLDKKVEAILTPLKNRVIMVSHPAYAYFCRDYQLKQLSIEFEGKDPSPQQLTKILTQARQFNIKTIFIQIQYNSKGAKLIAKEIGANIVILDPYAENYFMTMLDIAKSFAAQ